MTRPILLLFIFSIIFSCNNSETIQKTYSPPDHLSDVDKIKNVFLRWQRNEIDLKHFLHSDSCDVDWFDFNPLPSDFIGMNGMIYGFPKESNDYKYVFADLNEDGTLDGLILFHPRQCDGGNSSNWTKLSVLITSENGNYLVNDNIQVDTFSSTNFDSNGFYWIDSISANRIWADYIEFKSIDAMCCPSIYRLVEFNYSEKKLVHLGENIKDN